jgi:hypothetical protein
MFGGADVTIDSVSAASVGRPYDRPSRVWSEYRHAIVLAGAAGAAAAVCIETLQHCDDSTHSPEDARDRSLKLASCSREPKDFHLRNRAASG